MAYLVIVPILFFSRFPLRSSFDDVTFPTNQIYKHIAVIKESVTYCQGNVFLYLVQLLSRSRLIWLSFGVLLIDQQPIYNSETRWIVTRWRSSLGEFIKQEILLLEFCFENSLMLKSLFRNKHLYTAGTEIMDCFSDLLKS